MIKNIFILLVLIISSDLNGFISSITGKQGSLSIVMLGLTFFLFIKAFRSALVIDRLTKSLIYLYIFWFIYGTFVYFYLGMDFGDPIEKIRYYIPSILILYTFAKLLQIFIKHGQFNLIVKILTYSLIINCLVIIYSQNLIPISAIKLNNFDRSSGFIESVNQAGVTASFAQVFVLFQILVQRGGFKNRLILLSFYLITIYAGYLTFSKAAFLNILTIFLSFTIFLFAFKKNTVKEAVKTRRIKYYLIGLVAIILFLFLFFGQNYLSSLSNVQIERIDEFGQLISGQIDSETTTHRTEVGSTAFNLIKDDLFLGRGLSTFHNIPEFGGLGTHNTMLLLLGEAGMIGLILLIMYFYTVYISIFKLSYFSIKFLLFGLANVLFVTSMTSHTLLYVKLYIVIFAFINVTLYHFLNKEVENKKSHFV